jgi:hypothetical protein
MTQDNKQLISAQVLIRSASGKRLGRNTAITTQNIEDYAPSAEAVARAKRAFMDAGFEVGNLVGNSFSISAPISRFEKVFHTQLRHQERGGIEVAQASASARYELPLTNLPDHIADVVEAVIFTPPPDFGPTQFMS